MGVNLGRTADTLAKSDRPKVNVRPFYRKFKSGSCETIHHLQRALYFKIALYQNTAGLQKTPNICSNSIVQATTILPGSWGVDLGRTANTPAISDEPKVNVRAFYRKFKFGFFKATHYPYSSPCVWLYAMVVPLLLNGDKNQKFEPYERTSHTHPNGGTNHQNL